LILSEKDFQTRGGFAMKTEIYYFSSTGNSLQTARQIAENLAAEVKLISIPKILKKKIEITANKVGFIFPVYAWGMPRIVEDFLQNVSFAGEPYVFAVASCAGTPGGTLLQTKKILRKKGIKLAAGFVVMQPNYTFLDENIFMKIMIKIAGQLPMKLSKKLPEIVKKVASSQKHPIESSSIWANALGSFVHKMALGHFKIAARDFWTNEKCNMCQTCIQLCPRNNIKTEKNKIVWEDNCEACFACLQWCPQQAIEYQKVSIGKPRQHNPEIALDDI
jgi:Pyruvate/2-oxoacid:ferredoxin oxidoreductase delta subunit/flavodoxin